MRVVIKFVAAALAGVAAFLGFFLALRGMVELHEWGSGRFWNFAEEAEAFLLPEGYRGGVTLVFGDSSVPPSPRLGTARLYDFRGGPVLRVREAAPRGHRTPDWYFVDARGRRRHFLRGTRCEEPVKVEPMVCAPFGSSRITQAGGRSHEYETWSVVREWREAFGVASAASEWVRVAMRVPDGP